MKNADFKIWSFVTKNPGPTPWKKAIFGRKGNIILNACNWISVSEMLIVLQ